MARRRITKTSTKSKRNPTPKVELPLAIEVDSVDQAASRSERAIMLELLHRTHVA